MGSNVNRIPPSHNSRATVFQLSKPPNGQTSSAMSHRHDRITFHFGNAMIATDVIEQCQHSCRNNTIRHGDRVFCHLMSMNIIASNPFHFDREPTATPVSWRNFTIAFVWHCFTCPWRRSSVRALAIYLTAQLRTAFLGFSRKLCPTKHVTQNSLLLGV